MKDPRRSRHLFDLGRFVVDPEVAELLSYADVRRLVERHARGDWGEVSAERKAMNDAFAHPKNRSRDSSAQSVHVVSNAQICTITRQTKKRRYTRLFLL